MNSKIKEWLKRYLPAENLSIIATLLAALFTFQVTNNNVSTALAATWAGNLAYFGYIIIADVVKSVQTLKAIGSKYGLVNLLQTFKALIVEFGFAEIADSFFIRPALLYYLPILTGNLALGIILAKLAADITFYIPAIIGYEYAKRKFQTASN